MHITKRPFLSILIIATICLSVAGCSNDSQQSKTITIGVINLSRGLHATFDGFKAGMAELGYVEGKNVDYLYEGATGSIEGLSPAVQKLLEARVDLIFSITTPATIQAKKAVEGTDIPVVFAPVNDPVLSGIVENLRNPGGNITGIKVSGFVSKGLEYLKRALPELRNLFVPHNPKDKSAVIGLSELKEAAAKLDVNVVIREAHTLEDMKKVVFDIPEKTDAIFILPDNLAISCTKDIAKRALERRLAVYSVSLEEVQKGVLISYGVQFSYVGKQAARLAGLILKGLKPGDIPVEMADFFLSVNLGTAEAIGLEIPAEVLRLTDNIIR